MEIQGLAFTFGVAPPQRRDKPKQVRVEQPALPPQMVTRLVHVGRVPSIGLKT